MEVHVDKLAKEIRIVGARPALWGEAGRLALAMARRQWWRRAPFLPIPSPDYLAWRTLTAYGSETAEIDEADLIGYLRWRRDQRSR